MKLSKASIAALKALTFEQAKDYVENYKDAVISNVKYTAPKSNPTNFNAYAEIISPVHGAMVSATLEYCAERLAQVAALKQMHHL
jgi:hypothetical protein